MTSSLYLHMHFTCIAELVPLLVHARLSQTCQPASHIAAFNHELAAPQQLLHQHVQLP